MARAALKWSVEQSARAAGLSYRTILRFENDQRDIQPDLIAALRLAFEASGVRFLDAGNDAGAVVPPALRIPPPK